MPIQHLISRLVGLAALILIGATAKADDVTAHQLLNELARANEELHYTGTFTYQQGGSLESFKVFHWSEGEQQIERLEYLNGPEHQRTQRLEVNECSPLGHRLIRGPLAPATGAAEINRYYQVVERGVERVAGREARVMQIMPRDQMRYGYVWSLDSETGLLLKALVLDEQQRPVERFQFVELKLVDDPSEFDQQADLNREQQPPDQRSDCVTEQNDEPSRWVLRWQPPGFEFSGERVVDESSQMLMYTDGLTAFSVFIQPRDDKVVIDGRAQRGATSIHMGGVSDGRQDYRLAVVGEIPGAVAERLAQAVAPRNSSASGGSAEPEDQKSGAEAPAPTDDQ